MRSTMIPGSRLDRAIGICAASSVVNKGHLRNSVRRFVKWGVPVCVADQARTAHRYLAGPDEERAKAFDAFARDRLIGTIWCARGGYGATRILPLLDKLKTLEQLKRDPKLLLGFSDVTALHLYLYQMTGIPSVHSLMPGTASWQKMPARVECLLKEILTGELTLGKKSYTSEWKPKVLLRGKRDEEGVILGGNLSLVASMVGTPWQPNLRGKILFLEDCAEQPYRVDRMLTQLDNAGMLRGLRGVLLGDFEQDVVYNEPKEKKYWAPLFTERFAPLGIPVLTHLPVGHGKKNDPLPLGVRAVITKAGKLLLLEQPVRR